MLQGRSQSKCWACMSVLADGQKKCIHCSSWQNWRKRINVATLLTSFLLATVSVFGLAGPPLWAWIFPAQPNLGAVGTFHQNCDMNDQGVCTGEPLLTFDFVNIGDADIYLQNRAYCYTRENGSEIGIDQDTYFEFAIQFVSMDSIHLVPQEQQLVDLLYENYNFIGYWDFASESFRSCVISIQNHNGKFFYFQIIDDNDVTNGEIVDGSFDDLTSLFRSN